MAEAKFESLTEATSGAIGALVSTTVLYPLDTCKAKYQADVGFNGLKKYRSSSDVLFEAISKGQIVSLYQGIGTKNLQSVIAQFVYFYGYSYFKRLYIVKSGVKSIGTAMNLIIAAVAGACTAIITQPLDTAASRMQTSAFGKSKGLWETLSNGSCTEAFDGLCISLVLTSNPAIQYTIFDQLKQRFTNRQQSVRSLSHGSARSSPETLSASSAFLLGAISKSVATFITYPLIRCKIMIQASETEDESIEAKSRPQRTLISCISSIWRDEGIAGLFKGLQAQILKTVLSSALLLMVKERISRLTWIALLAFRHRLLISKKIAKNE